MPVFGGDNAESYFDEGLTAASRGDLPRAIEFLEKCIRLDSTYAAAYHQLGKVYYRLGNFQRAAAFLSQVVTAKPTQVPARVDLGYALLGQGNHGKARDLFQEALKQKPDAARAKLGLAHCAFQSGDKDAAIIIARDVAESGGPQFGALYLLARAANDAGRFELLPETIKRANAVLEKSIETSPNQPEAYYLRGLIYEIADDSAKAQENFQLAIDRAQPDKHYSAFEEHFTLADMQAKLAPTQG